MDVLLCVGLAIHLCFNYSWEANTKQEEMANSQLHQIRDNLRRKQARGGFGADPDNSAHESLLPRDSKIEDSVRRFNIPEDLTAIIPNATTI